jgi:hypothetical protein
MQRDIDAAERASLGVIDSYRVLVLVGDPQRARSLAEVGAALLGVGRPAELVLSRLITRPKAPLEVGAALVPDLARMASTVDELNALAGELKARGVAVSVLTRFSADPWTDLLAQAATVEADVVLVDKAFADQQPGSAIGPDHAFTLAVVRLGASTVKQGDVVGVTVDSGADGRTALVLASAAAGHLVGSLLVVSPDGVRAARKVTSALEPLRAQGVDVQMVSQTGDAVLVLTGGLGTPPSSDPAVTQVMVQAGLDDQDAELVQQMAKLAGAPGD